MEEIDAPMRAPFADAQGFSCIQGPRSAFSRPHAFRQDVFAVDLASTGEDPGVVVAPIDGDATVYDGCDERDNGRDAHHSSRCGQGYGNHVRIWDGQTMVLLAHLSKVTIKPGLVQAGQPVGIEGASGDAATRHVHMSVTRPAGKGADVRALLATPGATGSVPVRFRLTVRDRSDGTVAVRDIDQLGCNENAQERRRFWP